MNGRTNQRTEERTNEPAHEQTNQRVKKQIRKRTNEPANEQTSKRTNERQYVTITPPGFDLSQEPVECFAGQFVFFDGLFAAERRPDESVDQRGGVDVGGHGEPVNAFHDHQLLAQFGHALGDAESGLM